jgi:Tat protein translocase TatB subunit
MFGIGMTELLVIFVIGLLVLGPKRLPSLARSLGRSLAEFRRASNDIRREFMDVADEVRIDPPSLSDPPEVPPAESPRHEKVPEDAPKDAPKDAGSEPPTERERDTNHDG